MFCPTFFQRDRYSPNHPIPPLCAKNRPNEAESHEQIELEGLQTSSDIVAVLEKSVEPEIIQADVKTETPIPSNASSLQLATTPKAELPSEAPAAVNEEPSKGMVFARAPTRPPFPMRTPLILEQILLLANTKNCAKIISPDSCSQPQLVPRSMKTRQFRLPPSQPKLLAW